MPSWRGRSGAGMQVSSSPAEAWKVPQTYWVLRWSFCHTFQGRTDSSKRDRECLAFLLSIVLESIVSCTAADCIRSTAFCNGSSSANALKAKQLHRSTCPKQLYPFSCLQDSSLMSPRFKPLNFLGRAAAIRYLPLHPTYQALYDC